mgnify:CR=1 FL=1
MLIIGWYCLDVIYARLKSLNVKNALFLIFAKVKIKEFSFFLKIKKAASYFKKRL